MWSPIQRSATTAAMTAARGSPPPPRKFRCFPDKRFLGVQLSARLMSFCKFCNKRGTKAVQVYTDMYTARGKVGRIFATRTVWRLDPRSIFRHTCAGKTETTKKCPFQTRRLTFLTHSSTCISITDSLHFVHRRECSRLPQVAPPTR